MALATCMAQTEGF